MGSPRDSHHLKFGTFGNNTEGSRMQTSRLAELSRRPLNAIPPKNGSYENEPLRSNLAANASRP